LISGLKDLDKAFSGIGKELAPVVESMVNTAVIAAIVGVVVVIVIPVVACIICCVCQRRQRAQTGMTFQRFTDEQPTGEHCGFCVA